MLDLHNDEPSLVDALDRGKLVGEVADAIAHCTPPQVFGVHGGWGLGKTSFLHQVQWQLIDDCPQQSEQAIAAAREAATTSKAGQEQGKHKRAIRTVWFDAWRYQNEDVPVVALLHEMRAQLSWKSRTGEKIDRTLEVATRGALLSIEDLTKKIGFQYSKFRQANREWESENLAVALPSQTLREHLCLAIGKLLPEERKEEEEKSDGISPKLVVFIDDIDRCEPEAAYRLLECLKIYLTLDNCVFLLGMNQKVIEDAVAQRMQQKDDEKPVTRAGEYVEKLCQNVWRLPTIRDPKELLYDLLKKTGISAASRDLVKRGLEAAISERQEANGASHLLPPNPRKLKGLANLIGRLAAGLLTEGKGVTGNGQDDAKEPIREAQLLIVVAYIYQFHHDIYVRWEADSSMYNAIYDWCRGAGRKAHTFFEALELPYEAIEQPGVSPSGSLDDKWKIEPAYRDPGDAKVFWIQLLILHLGSEVASREFERYLHGVD